MNRTPQTHHMDWNGLTLEITTTPNAFLSRIAGEDYASLTVTDTAAAKPLINDAFSASLIRSAGGVIDFVDVMLTAQQAA